MTVFQSQNLYSFNFIKMYAWKKLKLFCVIDCQYLLLRGMKNTTRLTVWGAIPPLLVWCCVFWVLSCRSLPAQGQIATFAEHSVHLEMCTFGCKFRFSNLQMQIYIFTCSNFKTPLTIIFYILSSYKAYLSRSLSPSLGQSSVELSVILHLHWDEFFLSATF